MSHLRRYLERTAALPADELDMAVRRQQIYGGSLDSVLLELELVDAHTLGELLVHACGLPLAPFELIDDERDRPWAKLPDDVLEIGWAVPLVERGDQVWIAVHPDLPNERLGALYRSVPNVHPFVIPECCLEKIAAERSSSVVPQRYAVLCVAYLSALRRRPSLSDVGFPMLHDPGSGGSAGLPLFDLPPQRVRATMDPHPDDTDHAMRSAAISRAIPDEPEDEFERRPTIVFEPGALEHVELASHKRTAPPLAAVDEPPRGRTAPPPAAVDEPPRVRTELSPAMTAAPARTEPAPPAAPIDYPPSGSGPLAVVDSGPLASAPDSEVGDRMLMVPREALPPRPPPPSAAQHDPEPPLLPAPPATPIHAVDDAAAPIVLGADGAVVGGPPPVRFTARGTLISTPRELEAAFHESDVIGRVAGARSVLDAARTRDAAMDALAQALGVLAPRFAVLRIRNAELVGMSTPRSALADLGGRVVPIAEHGMVATTIVEGRYAGLADDEQLRRSLELGEPVPCLMQRIDVVSRPTLIVYVDHGGREFLPVEERLLDDLCTSTSAALAMVVRLRQGRASAEDSGVHTADEAGIGPPPGFGVAVPGSAWPPAPRHAAAIVSDGPGPRVRTRTVVDGSPPLRSAPPPLPGSRRPTTPIDAPRLEPPIVAQAPARITTGYADASASGDSVVRDEPVRAQLLTIHAMPPPPPLPPPPPMSGELLPSFDTLMGLPPPVQAHDSGPRFVPPPLDDRENSGIIPLSSPIDQPSMRGRIELDDEDWAHPGKQLASESMQRRVDTLLRSIAAGAGNVGELRTMGEPAMLRLAAQFPGPLEILRRDLRALPPPSAHGPLVRTAIRIGAEIVPHLIDLFDHPSPDVRFYAAFVFQELRDPRAMRPLSELAFDTSGDVRVISMRVLETYSRASGFLDAVRVVRAQLDSTNRTRQLYAARAVGTLRDIDAIAKLVDLLSSRDRFVQEAALESLCSITGQQLGLKPHRWKTWYTENEHHHRVEWIIESLRHRDLPVRRWAADELSRITNHRVPFSPMGDKKARELAVEAWTDWWNSTGASRMLSGTE